MILIFIAAHNSIEQRPLEIAADMNEYRHPLSLTSPGDIRLIHLLPGKNADRIQIRYERTLLSSSNVSYEALSYAWGSLGPTNTIYVKHNNIIFRTGVTSNLESALRHLRYTESTRILWVDALCINQVSDNAAKSTQIAQMDEIYSKARRVCVWLGEADDDSEKAMRFINDVSDLSKLDDLVKDKALQTQWLGLLTLMTKAWFSRRWVVQEIALAKEAIVYCGKDEVRWPRFADAVAILMSRSKEIAYLFNDDSYVLGEIQALGVTGLVEASNNLFKRSDGGPTEERLVTLEYLVSALKTFKVSHPWDTIYAVLALAKDTHRADKIRVDYDKPFAQVCKDFVSLTIRDTGLLDIICRPWAPIPTQIEDWYHRRPSAEILEPFYSLPSWVRYLSDSEFAERSDGMEERYDRVNADRFVGKPGQKIYSASGNSQTRKVRFRNKELSIAMSVKGFKVDRIGPHEASIGGPSESGNIPSKWLTIGSWEKYTSTPPPDQFWRTLVADRGLDGARPPIWYRNACGFSWSRSASGALDTTTVMKRCGSTMAVSFMARVRQAVWGRSLFVTEERSLIGLGPKEIKEQDLICILFGCSVPVILRKHPQEAYFTLVGECYIHGLMDGEAMKALQRKVYSIEEFEIR
jgi:hypothetical protein